MWASILTEVLPYVVGGGGGMLAYYIKSSFGDPVVGLDIGGNPVHKSEKHDPRDISTYDIIKRGYDAMGAMAKDIHNLYHPPGCKCAICQIRADDDAEDPAAYTGTYCSLPCFNCTVLTCPTHPDRKPTARPVSKATERVEAHAKITPQVADDDDTDQVRRKLRTDVRNLEAMMSQLTQAYREVLAERDSLRDERGLQSAGMHVGGKPLYLVDPQWDPKQVDGGVHAIPFELRSDETDSQAMQRLAQVCRDEKLRVNRKQRLASLEAEERENPGGTMIEEFGEGAVRYIPPPRKRTQQTVYVRPGEWRNA